mgnify:CR=1 FL=1
MPITSLPTPPSRTDAANFNARADAFLGALPTFASEMNEAAESMILKLAGFLRYSLDRQPTEMAALTAEMDAQRKYLEIEQTREQRRTNIQWHHAAHDRAHFGIKKRRRQLLEQLLLC